MPLEIEVLTPEDAEKNLSTDDATRRILGLARQMDQLLESMDVPIAIRIHRVRRPR